MYFVYAIYYLHVKQPIPDRGSPCRKLLQECLPHHNLLRQGNFTQYHMMLLDLMRFTDVQWCLVTSHPTNYLKNHRTDTQPDAVGISTAISALPTRRWPLSLQLLELAPTKALTERRWSVMGGDWTRNGHKSWCFVFILRIFAWFQIIKATRTTTDTGL